jgi:hypothetical protein
MAEPDEPRAGSSGSAVQRILWEDHPARVTSASARGVNVALSQKPEE